MLLAAFVAGNACISSVGDKNSQSDDLLLQNARKQGQLLKRTAYTLSYDKDTRLPIWVAWCLTKEHTYGPYKRKGLHFEEDTAVPKPRATYFDYMQSGYSRGHMCPSGDNRWSLQAQQESFLYTNCCPQLYSLNAGDWNELEMKCRHWANKYGEIYIVCGPLLFNKQHRTIGKNRVVVPEAFFKVVLCRKGSPKAIGFVYRNEGKKQAMKDAVRTVDEIERLTRMDFFPALDDKTETRIEAQANLADW